jgi:hypothetical protein
MSLNSRIGTDRDDYDKLQTEATTKMDKIRKKAAEVEGKAKAGVYGKGYRWTP